MVKAKVDEFAWKVLPHLPYSCDLAPSDYHLFRSMSNSLKKKIFKNGTELKKFIQAFFDSHLPAFYARDINLLPDRWRKVSEYDGEYFDYIYIYIYIYLNK